MARLSSLSGISSATLDHKVASGAMNRRDKMLRVAISSGKLSLPSVDAFREINDLREEDVWGEEAIAGLEYAAHRSRDGYGHDYSRCNQTVHLSKVVGGNRRWLIRDKDSFLDTGGACGLSLISQLDRGLGMLTGQDSMSGRKLTASRLIPLSQSSQSDEPGGEIQQQSAPVDVPDWSKILGTANKSSSGSILRQTLAEDDDEDEERLPPHELLAREYARAERTTFSVFEGVGRTLKGRDLSRVRNAVLRRTGFLDL